MLLAGSISVKQCWHNMIILCVCMIQNIVDVELEK
mgnify:CR=1 FL=1